MRARQRYAQLLGNQQHHRRVCAGDVGKEFRMTAERYASIIDDAFLQRPGYQARELAPPTASFL